MTRASPEFQPLSQWSGGREFVTETGELIRTYPTVLKNWGAGSLGVLPFHRTYLSTNTPDYYNKLKLGNLPYHSHTMELHKTKDSPYYGESKQFNGRTTVSWSTSTAALYTLAPSQLLLDNGLTDAENKATLRLGKQLSAIRFNAAQFLGERKQTAELLASTATRIAQASRALKNADFRTFRRALSLTGTETRTLVQSWNRVAATPRSKRVASHWLEYVYGWKPLLQDVYDATELLADKINRTVEPEGVVMASAKSSRRYGRRELQALGCYDEMASYEGKANVKLKAHYRLDSVSRSLLAQTGITNPALLAWELMPYSFVVDWFVPVGTYLESLTAFDGFDLVTGKSGIVRKELMEYVLDCNLKTDDRIVFGKCEKRSFRYYRSPLLFWPDYTLKVKSPIGGEPLNRFLTATSLLRVTFDNPARKR